MYGLEVGVCAIGSVGDGRDDGDKLTVRVGSEITPVMTIL
jgi:hypothetical protein